MTQQITFITGNAKKAEELASYLNYPILHKKVDLTEIQSLDIYEIVKHKVSEAYSQIKSPVLVEDTSLSFSSLGKLPGPLIKWFSQELGNEGLCRILNNFEDRSVVAQVVFGFFDGKDIKYFEGSMDGIIADSPKGQNGFGWDPIFIPKGFDKTWGEMTPEEKEVKSMRKLALQKLEKFLSTI